MALPPNFLEEIRARASLKQVAARKVTWDSRKSNEASGIMWARCPFHHEKTASFKVDDREGLYYCFGCQASGNVFKFVQETENVDFMEAVRMLARETGLQLPSHDPKHREKADLRSRLEKAMEMAVRHFRLQIKTSAAAPVREYLANRGLGETDLDRFEIGFAPDRWQGLWNHLREIGIEDDSILKAGLAKRPNDNREPYDTFRGRIMFPIRDAQGRCIAFGGRATDPNATAKYLNSPETELFNKSKTLYNFNVARKATGKSGSTIVAEGYMDVVALARAGFEASVAPMGTALTEYQLQMLWKVTDEPVIALDGDMAGMRAAQRAIDIAMPLLAPGKSLRFATLPDGMDPDDLIREKGPNAMRSIAENAQTMVEYLFQRETEDKDFNTPERKAALKSILHQKVGKIKDGSLKKHYIQALNNMCWKLFNPWLDGRRGNAKSAPYNTHSKTKKSYLASIDVANASNLREALVLAILLRNPEFVAEFENSLENLQCQDPAHGKLLGILLRHRETASEILMSHALEEIGQKSLDKLMKQPHLRLAPSMRNPDSLETARMDLSDNIAVLKADRDHKSVVDEAARDINEHPHESVTWRLNEAKNNRDRVLQNSNADKTAYDTGENGIKISKSEKKKFDHILRQTGVSDGSGV
ncbi:MAG: DNA primase [Roseovarius sp.]|nr:DNA primase [Roseovarius sp.]